MFFVKEVKNFTQVLHFVFGELLLSSGLVGWLRRNVLVVGNLRHLPVKVHVLGFFKFGSGLLFKLLVAHII